MFEIGDLVVYGGEGVCRVEDIGCPDKSSIDKSRTYYTLRSVYTNGVTYTPVDTKVHMRPVITFDQAKMLIERIPDIQAETLEGGDARELADHYRKTIMTYDCDDLVKLIKTVYSKKVTVTGKGKKLGQIDERYMKRAEDMLHGELAVVLNIPKEKVRDYIKNSVKEHELSSAKE